METKHFRGPATCQELRSSRRTIITQDTCQKHIDSILAQTFQDFELIILDNASTDNSRKVIESYTRHQNARAASIRRITAVPSSSGTWGSAKRKVNMYGSPNRTITRTRAAGEPRHRLDRHPTSGLPCVSRGQSTRTVNCWETIDICWNVKITVHTGARITSTGP